MERTETKTQLISCTACGKLLGTLNCNTGDLYSAYELKEADQAVKKDKPPNAVEKTVKRGEHFKTKKVLCNLDDKIVITCSCGHKNGIY